MDIAFFEPVGRAWNRMKTALFKPFDLHKWFVPDEVEILEDLIVAAHTDAKTKIEAMLQDKMKDLTGGLPIPPGMNLF